MTGVDPIVHRAAGAPITMQGDDRPNGAAYAPDDPEFTAVALASEIQRFYDTEGDQSAPPVHVSNGNASGRASQPHHAPPMQADANTAADRIASLDRPPTLVDLIECANTPPKVREFIVEQLVPRGVNVLLSANGGFGKSGLMIYVAVCTAAGIDCFGLATQRTVVVLLSCEDDADEIHRRIVKVCRAVGVDPAKLIHWLFIYDAVGTDAALFSRRAARTDSGAPLLMAAPDTTDMFDWLAEKVQSIGAGLVILDSLSDTFDGSEIDRAQVRRYMTSCLGLFGAVRGSIIHVGHVDKAAARGSATGQHYTGSTAFNNSVRTRIALMPAADAEPGVKREDDGRRLLVVEKSNYTRAGFTIPLRFDQELGVFVKDADEASGVVANIRDRNERRELLRVLLECETKGVDVQTPRRANDNAAAVLGKMPGYPRGLRAGKAGADRLWQHLRDLTADRLIEEEAYKTVAGHRTACWKVTASGRNEATTQ